MHLGKGTFGYGFLSIKAGSLGVAGHFCRRLHAAEASSYQKACGRYAMP